MSGKDAGLGGRGLLLVPSVFTYPRPFSITSELWQPTLRYPPRGLATLWHRGEEPIPDALAAVVGRARPQHLTATRAAGLVSAHRSGRYVLYARTAAGEALVHAASGGQPWKL